MHCSPKAMGERVGTAKSDDGQINLKLDRPVAPLEDFVVADGKLRFTDLGQKHGVLSASIYSYSWFSFDNQSGRKSPVAGVSSDAVPAALASSSEGSFMACTLTDTKQTHRTGTVVFRRDGDQWKPVGIERTSL